MKKGRCGKEVWPQNLVSQEVVESQLLRKCCDQNRDKFGTAIRGQDVSKIDIGLAELSEEKPD